MSQKRAVPGPIALVCLEKARSGSSSAAVKAAMFVPISLIGEAH